MITLEKQPIDTTRTSLWRSRWAAIGAAVAVSLGAGGIFVAQAAPGPLESTIVSVTPERILDTRDPVNLGLPGPFISPVGQKLQVTGSIPTATGTKIVVPTGATGVLLNVTSVSATANGFISIRPGDATGTPSTSSLNVTAGITVPNSVQVSMPTAGPNAGKIDITWDALGTAGPTTDILIDVVGYTTNTGLQQLVTNVAAKANAADVYTKVQSDAKYPQGYAPARASLAVTNWPAGDLRVVTVTCPSGMSPVGGGGSNSANGVAIDGTFPTPFDSASPTGWNTFYRNVSGGTIVSIEIRSHVICMTIPGKAGAATAPATSAGEDGKS